MPDLRRLVRESAGASYYRQQPLEIARFARSKATFARHRRSPDAIIAGLGLDVLASRGGLDHWAEPLGEMVEQIDRVNREETTRVPWRSTEPSWSTASSGHSNPPS